MIQKNTAFLKKNSLFFKVFLFPGFKLYFKELSMQNMCQDANRAPGGGWSIFPPGDSMRELFKASIPDSLFMPYFPVYGK
jgi:hypothetical protein